MVAKTSWLRSAAALALAGQLLVAVPAQAADDTSTGLLAALGLEAAGGETKLGDKGGEIEGWMLASTSLDEVARKILEDVGSVKKYNDRTVVVLARNEAFDLGLASLLSGRITLLHQRIETYNEGHHCTKPPKGKSNQFSAAMMGIPAALTLGDIAGAAKTDTNIAGFDIALDERALINAIGHANASLVQDERDLRIPADATLVPTSGVLGDWNDLQKAAVGLGVCPGKDDDAGTALKADLDALNGFATTQGEKGAPSPLERAGALGDLIKQGKAPLVLRVAVEKVGGTTIVRSNIFYKLGFPGAVVISGGIVVSYRLIDAERGVLVTGGVVRCALPQVGFGSVAHRVSDPKPNPANCAN